MANYAKQQICQYQSPEDDTEPWRGTVMGHQCFYGFKHLEYSNAELDKNGVATGHVHEATFGGWLPDDAITAVKQWLQAKRAAGKVNI